MTYSLYCGDAYVTTVTHQVERIGVLSQQEYEEIQEKARNTYQYENYHAWWGYGYLTIKIHL